MSSSINDIIQATRGEGRRPPIDESPLEGPPSLTRHEFKRQKLRQFAKSGSRISWLKYLGNGVDGIVFKAIIGDSDPVAVKVFWRTRRPTPIKFQNGSGSRPVQWSFEEECRTVAWVEKLRWAMRRVETDAEHPILIKHGPKSRQEAVLNFDAFCDEARQSPIVKDGKPPPPFPMLPKCYGWMRVQRDDIPDLYPPVGWDIVDMEFDWHWAIVYEFVPGEMQDRAVAQAHLDFFHAVGFSLEPYKPDNWHGGRLVDMNDIYTPFTNYWRRGVQQYDAEKWVWTLEFTRGPTRPRKIWRRKTKSATATATFTASVTAMAMAMATARTQSQSQPEEE